MLMLKLQRIGKKHQGTFRLIVGEKREKLNGAQLEDLGWFNPHSDKFEFKKDRILHWVKMGAQKTDTVNNLLIKAGVITGKKIAVHKHAKKSAEAKPVESSAVAKETKAESPNAEAAPEEKK